MSELGLAPSNWISGAKQGTWTEISSEQVTITLYFMALIFFGIFTTYIQTTRGFGVGLFYMLLLVFSIVVILIEGGQDITSPVAVVDLGPLHRWILAVPIGVGIGVLFALGLQFTIGAFLPFESVAIFGVPVKVILAVIGPVVAIPIAEEAFFGGVLTPTIAESLGIIPAAILSGLVWDMWHLGTYSSSVTILIALFFFRFIATFVIMYTKSLMPTIVAHILVNFMGVFFVA